MKRYYIFGKDGNYSFGLLDLDRMPFPEERHAEVIRKYDDSCRLTGSLLHIGNGAQPVIDEIARSITEANKTKALDLGTLIQRVEALNTE